VLWMGASLAGRALGVNGTPTFVFLWRDIRALDWGLTGLKPYWAPDEM
jgi:hypothetical protein